MNKKALKRSFVLGDEWIYYKFYSGVKTADKILEEAIKPIIEHLINTNRIDKWFFIRYADPDLHLRVRLHYTKKVHIGIIVQTVFKHIEKFVANELIWKVQTDTYQREVERYGIQTIELSEQFFFYESNLFLNILPLLRNSEGETQRWILALKLINNLLDCFRFSLSEKLVLLEGLKDGFAKEFGMNQFLKGQLDVKFRKERSFIEQTLDTSSEKESIIGSYIIYINDYNELIRPIAVEIITKNNKVGVPLENLITSYIHMTMNRIFKSKQRLHEMVLYDFLFRYYKSSAARQNQINKKTTELVNI